MIRLGAALVLALILSGCDFASNYLERTQFEVQGDRLLMTGLITSYTPGQFERMVAAHPQVDTVVLRGIEGSVDDAAMIAMGYRLRALGLDTHLESYSQIYSGGAQLFLSGVERTMERGAIIGVHSWRDNRRDGSGYPRGSPKHGLNRRYVEDMLGSDAFYWFTLRAAPSNGMHILNEAEIAHYRLLTRPILAP